MLIYINDVAKCVRDNSTNSAIFSNDTSVSNSGETDYVTKQTDLDQTNDWFSFKNISMNVSKCGSLNSGPGKVKQLVLLNETIINMKKCKFLGLFNNCILTLKEHVAHLVKE